jgi:hypothetical protein
MIGAWSLFSLDGFHQPVLAMRQFPVLPIDKTYPYNLFSSLRFPRKFLGNNGNLLQTLVSQDLVSKCKKS